MFASCICDIKWRRLSSFDAKWRKITSDCVIWRMPNDVWRFFRLHLTSNAMTRHGRRFIIKIAPFVLFRYFMTIYDALIFWFQNPRLISSKNDEKKTFELYFLIRRRFSSLASFIINWHHSTPFVVISCKKR